MAIEKNHFKASRFDSEFSMGSRDSASSEEDELQQRSSAIESDEDDEFDDADSGAGSDDDFDLLELGETGAEFCQIGSQTCSIPFELYDLPGLEEVLSMDVWNECLSEEDRFNLAKYLPDIDQETFVRTLKELFTGCNFHFGSPITKLFDMLKGGLCEPRVALYRQGLNFFQKRQHYYLLQRHQNNMVGSLHQIRDAWLNCRGYSIEERLRVLNIMRSQKSLWSKRLKDRKLGQKMGLHTTYGAELLGHSPSNKATGYDPAAALRIREHMRDDDDADETMYEMAVHRDRNVSRGGVKLGKKLEFLRGDEFGTDSFEGFPLPLKNDLHAYGKNRNYHESVQQSEVEDQMKSAKASPQMSDRLLHSEYRTKPSEEKIRGSSSQNGGSNVAALKGVRMFVKSEETESDSSEQVDEEADNDPLMRSKLAYPTEVESYSSKVKQKGKMRDTSHLHSSEARLEDSYFSGSGQLNDDDDRKQTHKLGKSGHIRAETGERLHMSSSKAYSAERRQKLEVDYEYPAFRSNYLHVDERDNPLETRLLADDGKRKLEDDGGSLDMGTSETPITEMGATDLELDTKPQKKPFTLITPTVHTGFSFSIVHLLSAVRMAMITPLPEDSLEVGRQKPSGEQNIFIQNSTSRSKGLEGTHH
ncbi:unnamed protein product, partial [Vitis vinifera]